MLYLCIVIKEILKKWIITQISWVELSSSIKHCKIKIIRTTSKVDK